MKRAREMAFENEKQDDETENKCLLALIGLRQRDVAQFSKEVNRLSS